MEETRLTAGAIAGIADGSCAGTEKPILQVLDLKLAQTPNGSVELYQLLLSDGARAAQATLATHMDGLVASGALRTGSIVRLVEFECHTIHNRKIIIVFKLDVILESFKIIGKPIAYDINPATAFSPMPVKQPLCHSSQAPADVSSQSTAAPVSTGSIADQCSGMHISTKMEPASRSSLGFQNRIFSRRLEDQEHRGSAAQKAGLHVISDHQVAEEIKVETSIYDHKDDLQTPPSYKTTKPVTHSDASFQVIAITALRPQQSGWAIKGRVTSKGELRHYSCERGDGKVFSFMVLDSEGTEIQVSSFNDVADKFYGQIHVGNIYLISRGSVKNCRKKFNLANHNYEIVLESTSLIEHCIEEDCIPRQQFNFRPIAEIESIEENMLVDVIGFVLSITPSMTIPMRTGKKTLKRTLHLKDLSGKSIEVTLWGGLCNEEGIELKNMCDSGSFPVLAVKSGRVSDFAGRSINTISTTRLFVDPDFPEAQRLKDWSNTVGKNFFAISILRETTSMGQIHKRKTISQIKYEHLGRSVKPEWISVKSVISSIRSNTFCFSACPMRVGDWQCNKKVSNDGEGSWRCDRCEKSFPECNYRYLLQVQIQDHTGSVWVTAFDDSGEKIMGISAQELYLLKYDQFNHEKVANIIQRVVYKQCYIFSLKVKEDTFNDERQLKLTVTKAEKVDSSSESRDLIELIGGLLIEDPSITCESFEVNSFSRISGSDCIDPIKYEIASVGGSGCSYEKYVAGAGMHQSRSYCSGYDGGVGKVTGGREVRMGYATAPRNRAILVDGCLQPEAHVNHTLGTLPGNCYKCQQPGHWARNCPRSKNAFPTSQGSTRYD